MFSLRKRKQQKENLILSEMRLATPKIENYIEIHIESMDADIRKKIYQKLMENTMIYKNKYLFLFL